MNLRDGTVRLEAEGSRTDVSELIRSVLDEMGGLVVGHEESWGSATGELPDFAVRREAR